MLIGKCAAVIEVVEKHELELKMSWCSSNSSHRYVVLLRGVRDGSPRTPRLGFYVRHRQGAGGLEHPEAGVFPSPFAPFSGTCGPASGASPLGAAPLL